MLVAVLPRIADVDDFALDVANFLGDGSAADALDVFPAWESLPSEHNVSDAIFGGRLRVLQSLDMFSARRIAKSSEEIAPRVLVTSIEALLQPVPSRAARAESTRTIRVGEELDRDEFLRWLVDCGFERTGGVEVPGEFCVHGGILDVYPPDAADPLRFELFGDDVESIRRFDAETQRKTEDVSEVTLTLVAPVSDDEQTKASRGPALALRACWNRCSIRFPTVPGSHWRNSKPSSTKGSTTSHGWKTRGDCSALNRCWNGSRSFRTRSSPAFRPSARKPNAI